ncbi:peptide deformylase [Candidatus Gottesmanbacteria bacterium]|nr:peptide deformylase [Candidatus Gottesmanbacteria bacterium]
MKLIVKVPNPVLTTSAQAVTVFDKNVRALVDEMKKTLMGTNNPKGVGLAAPQIGQSWRVFITRPTETSRIRVFINPEIIKRSEELTEGIPGRDNKLEGCLSIPKIWGKVKRAAKITLRYQDEKDKIREENFDGFFATIVQHETDHINGILYTQRVLEQKGKLYQAAKDKEGKEVLEEITI